MNHTNADIPDQELAQRVLRGEQELFRTIVERTEKLVIHIISGMVRSREDREDLAQDVYLKAYKHLPAFRYESKLSTWIARIAYNTCVNHLQKKRLALTDTLDGLPDATPALSGDPFERLSEREVSVILRRAIAGLSPLNTTLITLFHQASLTISEIAHVTGLPEGTVKSYLYRARKQLQQHLLTLYQNKEAL